MNNGGLGGASVYVGGFAYELSDEDLRAFFNQIGGVTGAKASRRRRGHCPPAPHRTRRR